MRYICTLDLPDLVCPYQLGRENTPTELMPPADRRRGNWKSTSCSAAPRQECQGILECNSKICSGNENCSYCMEDKRKEEIRPKGYVRKERWYERYYQPINNRT